MKDDHRLPRPPGVSEEELSDEDAANDGGPDSSPAPRSRAPRPRGATPKPPRASSAPTPRPSRAATPRPPTASETPPPRAVDVDTAPRSRRAPKMESEAPRSRRTPPPPRAKAAPEPTPKPRASVKPKAPKRGSSGKRDPQLDDSHAQKFFAEGESQPLGDSHRPAADTDPSAFGLPSARRSTYKRYVYGLVGVCVVLLLLGVLRSALAPAAAPAARALPLPPPPVAAAPAIPPPPPEPVAAPAPSAAPADSSAVPGKSAVEERDDARRLLEKGKAKDAAEAAARSTALDPTDGDVWLLLGAADMELGKSGDARAAFTECVKQGKKGEISDCRGMLR